jgi:uridine kinase
VRVLAVSGRSGSGKTALALSLTDARPAGFARLALDRYYRDARPRESTDGFFWRVETIDVELLREHVARLAAGEPVTMPEYDWRAFRRVPHADARRRRRLTVAPRHWLVVDGMCAGPPLLPADLALHLDVPFATACERGARRAVRYGQEPDLVTALAHYTRWASALEPEMARLKAAADVVASSPSAARRALAEALPSFSAD